LLLCNPEVGQEIQTLGGDSVGQPAAHRALRSQLLPCSSLATTSILGLLVMAVRLISEMFVAFGATGNSRMGGECALPQM